MSGQGVAPKRDIEPKESATDCPPGPSVTASAGGPPRKSSSTRKPAQMRIAGSAAIQAASPGSVIHVVPAGARMAAVTSKPTGLAMPGFGGKLDDAQLADLINYIRHAWGDCASSVDAHTIAAVRKDINSPLGDRRSTRR